MRPAYISARQQGWPTYLLLARLHSNGRWCLSSVGIVVCNTPLRACRRLQLRRPGDDVMPPRLIAPRLHGGPVVLRPVKATPCFTVHYTYAVQNNLNCSTPLWYYNFTMVSRVAYGCTVNCRYFINTGTVYLAVGTKGYAYMSDDWNL